jgi:hypothetical protein
MKANFSISDELYNDMFVKDVTEHIVAFRLPKPEATIARVEKLCELKAGVSDLGEYLFITINRRHVDDFKILQL